MSKAALVLGYVYDHAFSEDVAPLKALLELPMAGSTFGQLVDTQVQLPLATGRLTRPAKFNWARLAPKLARGELASAGIHRRLPSPDRGHLSVHIRCTPLEHLEAHRTGTYEAQLDYRYTGTLQIGSDYLEDDADAVLAGLFERWIARIQLRAGVIVADASRASAEQMATCSSGVPGNELFERARNLFFASWTWGPYAREPEWGTFLTRAHADAIGGAGAIQAAVAPHRILESNGVLFVQLTRYEDALQPVAADKRDRLEALMRPILDGPPSRAISPGTRSSA
jgi:hypothetical protein